MVAEVLILTAFGQGHLFLSMELCKLMASRNYKTTLVVFSTVSPSNSSSLLDSLLIQKTHLQDIKLGEIYMLPGLLEEMVVTQSDLKQRPLGPPQGLVRLMINMCDDIEHPFIEYLTKEINKAIEWLDSKPHGLVLYVSFGSLVVLSLEEYLELTSALEESIRPFMWVILVKVGGLEEEGYYTDGLNSKVGERGLIIKGLGTTTVDTESSIMGGFLSHCGWNSTMEEIWSGIPFLTLPLRGDQYYNYNLVVKQLKVGYRIYDDLSNMVKKDNIVKGIETLFEDKDMKKRAHQPRHPHSDT
ncbi:hypothetical protein ACOSP7_003289 [Xanthoceras sorbifolium]